MKNGFLTFCFAFVPGAGQMYQGYMKRGLSLISLFCASWLLTTVAVRLVLLLPILWMYSFFDTFNLRAQLGAGIAPEDDYLFHLGGERDLGLLLARRHKLAGWGLVVLGVYMIYDGILMSGLYDLAERLESRLVWFIYDAAYDLPELLLCLALILLGLWLVRGGHPSRPAAEPHGSQEDFCDYIAQEDEFDDRT